MSDDEVQEVSITEVKEDIKDGVWVQWIHGGDILIKPVFLSQSLSYLGRKNKYRRFYKDYVEYTDDILKYRPYGMQGYNAWVERNEMEIAYRQLRRETYLNKRNHWWAFREISCKLMDLGFGSDLRKALAKHIIEFLLEKK